MESNMAPLNTAANPGKKSPPLLLVILGFVVIICVPLAFFVFGWRTLDVSCRRIGAVAACQVDEHFAAGLYTRHTTADDVTDIGFKSGRSHRPGSVQQTVLVSTVAFETPAGLIPVSEVSSNVDDDAKKGLIRAFRGWFASGQADFVHHARMISIFGWLGALGMAFWGCIIVSLPYYWFKKLIAGRHP